MALIDFEGFETETDARENRSVSEFEGGYLPAYGRNGNGVDLTFSSSFVILSQLSFETADTMIVGFAWQPNESGARSNSSLLRARAGTTTIWTLGLDGTNLTFNGGAVSATGTATFSLDNWYYIEIKVLLSDSGGTGTYEVRVDGVTDISGTGVNNTDSTGQTITEVRFGLSGNTADYYLDDVYICDGTGTVNNDFLGDVKVERLAPTGNGTTNDGVGSDGNSTDNYLLVDDTGNLGTTEFVQISGTGTELYSTGTLGAGEVPVGVMVSASFIDGDVAETYDGLLRIGTTTYEADAPANGSGTLTLRDWLFETNPDTAAAWAEDDLDGVEFGIVREA